MSSMRMMLIAGTVAALMVLAFATGREWGAPKARNDFQSLMTLAVNNASRTNGATMTFAKVGNQTEFCVWWGRPIPGNGVESPAQRCELEDTTVTIAGVAMNPAILLSTGAQASETSWVSGDATLGADGTCASGSLTVTFKSGLVSLTSTVPCAAPSQIQ